MDAFLEEFQHLKIQLKEIQSATDNFGENNIIGRGGFGNVYKGAISHKEQSFVAIKRLDRKHGQGNTEFWREITMLSRYTHENLVSLVGFCDQRGEKILVYEHAYHGSLDKHLSSTSLTWTQRLKICLDAARGLSYLHDDRGSQQRVLHRDIKSSNILLDENWTAKVSDMGLSKIGPSNQQHTVIVTDVVGTVGYLDPMYMQTGILSKESDVYSFGVVLLEVLCGRLCFEKSNGHILVHSWKQSYNQNKLDEIIFKDIVQQIDSESLEIYSDVAFQSLRDSRVERPTMPYVVEKLESALEIQEWLAYYENIVRTAVPPLQYTSKAELSVLLSNGVLLNGGKTWLSLDDNGKHREMISIAECLLTYASENVESQYSSDFNSRFASGTYSPMWDFRTRVRTQFLSPLTEYTVNLVFKCLRKDKAPRQQYIDIHYKFKENTHVATVHLSDNRKDEWLKAGLCEFTSDQSSIVDLEFLFAGHMYLQDVKVEGIEFEPTEKPNMLVDDLEKFFSDLAEPEPVGYALVEVLEGSDMKPSGLYGRANPYLKGQLGPYKFRTKTQKKTLSPKWYEEFKLPIISWDLENLLEIEVFDKGHFVDDFLGACLININDIRDGERHDMWKALENIKMGRLHLCITVNESV